MEGDVTREEERVWRKLEEYVKARQKFFKEEAQPAWKAWKTAELQLVAQFMEFKRGEKK